MANILLVDDISFIKKIEKNVLESSGHVIVGDASNGEDAIRLYREKRPDIVIMDITMPVLNGIEALEKILSIDAKANVIMCSALAHERILLKAIKAGAKEYIIKPFTTERLISTIEKVLAHSK